MPRKLPLFCFALLFLFKNAVAQGVTKIDQLRSAIHGKASKEKLQAVLAFCDEWESFSPDTLKKYADQAGSLAREQKDQRATILASYYQAAWLFQTNKLDTAFTLIIDVLKQYQESFPYDEFYVKLYGLKGNILTRTARMEELMAHNYNLIRLAEQNQDTLGVARGILGIGNVNLKLKKYNEALNWYHKALGLLQNQFHKRRLSFIYNNIGITFYHLQNEDSAFHYINQGVLYSKQDQNLTNLANALFLHGGMMAEFNHPKEAEGSFKEAVAIRKKIGDIYYLITDMSQVALFYANTGQMQKGIALCNEGLALAERNGQSYSNINGLYEVLGRNYSAAGDYKSYSDVLYKQLALKDSMYKQSSAQAIAEMQAKYELQKKENTIIQQKLDLVSKNYQVYGSLALLLLAIVAAAVILRQYRRRQQLRLRLLRDEENRKAEKAVMMAEETERKRIAADLHDSLGAYVASIASNIDHLQHATPENKAVLQELKGNAQAIVLQLSDTIWVLKNDALSLTAISDRLKLFIQKIAPSYPAVTIDVCEEIETEDALPPAQAFHLFQIIKEAINNSLRHSRCTRITVKMIGNKGWRLSISDDGSGIMQSTTVAEGGNGLVNMRARAAESGWQIQWQKAQPKGTTVIIEPTTN
ncbi:MAG TPA: ATP-binding protein [Flavisolibacter sp.]|nr:ATP-binding protein [Flavisolibacter sp.]